MTTPLPRVFSLAGKWTTVQPLTERRMLSLQRNNAGLFAFNLATSKTWLKNAMQNPPERLMDESIR